MICGSGCCVSWCGSPAAATVVRFRRALLVGIVGLNDGFFGHTSASVVYCVAGRCARGQRENHV